jgi:hypothetical protein
MQGVLDLDALKKVNIDKSIDLQDFSSKRNSPNTYVASGNHANINTLLKKEESEDITFTFQGRKKVITSSKVSEPKLSMTKFLMFLVTIILLTGSSIGAYFLLYKTEDFYKSTWQGVLTEEERSQGIKSLSYKFDDNKLVETIMSETNNIEITARLSSSIQFTSKLKTSAAFVVENKYVDSIEIIIPDTYCPQERSKCDELKVNFDNTFRKNIGEQNKLMANQKFKVSKLNDSQLRLQSDIVGERFLKPQS